MEDNRPDAPPKKNAGLDMAYRWYIKLVVMRGGNTTREVAIERGKSNMPLYIQEAILGAMDIDAGIEMAQKLMIEEAKKVGPIFDWLIGLKGISEDKAAQILAMIDDIEKFPLISKLRRFAGLAVFDGQAEIGTPNYARRFKAMLLGPTLIVDQFVRHHTPVYRDHYDWAKDHYYQKYPEPQCNKCDAVAEFKRGHWVCPNGCKVGKGFKIRHTPLHIDKMARRKVAGLFISHLWQVWREYEGLPLTVPWILREGTGHTTFIEPPMVEELVIE